MRLAWHKVAPSPISRAQPTEERNGLRRRVRAGGTEEEARRLQEAGAAGGQGLDGARRARVQGVRRRRREGRQADLVSPGGEAEGGGGRRLLLHRLQESRRT